MNTKTFMQSSEQVWVLNGPNANKIKKPQSTPVLMCGVVKVDLRYAKWAFWTIHQNQHAGVFWTTGRLFLPVWSPIKDLRIGMVHTTFLVIRAMAPSMGEVTARGPRGQDDGWEGIKGSFIRKPFKEFSIRRIIESQKVSIDARLIREMQHEKTSQEIRVKPRRFVWGLTTSVSECLSEPFMWPWKSDHYPLIWWFKWSRKQRNAISFNR